MRKCLQTYCFCWFGRPAVTGDIQDLIERKEDSEPTDINSWEREDMAEHLIDTSNWQSKDIQDLTPNKIKDSDLTKEYYIQENKREDKIKELGYELGDDIGRGAFGRVRLVYNVDASGSVDKSAGNELACKIIELKAFKFGNKDKNRMSNFKNELFILVKSKHKNIIKVKDHFILNNLCYLIMEYANIGNMSTDCKRRGPYNEDEAMTYFGQISSALYYLHCKLGIAHLDLKLGNFLIFGANDYKQRTVKVTDFGLSRLRMDPKKGIIQEVSARGTLTFMSPQVLRLYILNKLDEESVYGKFRPFNPFIADVWALGVCLYIMLFRDYPFHFEDDPRLLRNILENQRHKNYRLPEKYAKNLSIGCTDMIADCLEPNPHKRLTIQNIVCHYWFENKFTIEELSGVSP